MQEMFFLFLFAFCVLHHVPTTSSRIKIVQNGYENILIALPFNTPAQDRTRLVTSLKDLFQQSSLLLSEGLKGRAYFRSVVFLVPETWGEIDSWLPGRENTTTFKEAGATFNREDADVVVTDTREDDFPYTLHQGGCGSRALRIYLPSSFLMSNSQENKSESFAHLWSEFRYGIFIEDGFEGDKMFPLTYHMPGDSKNRTTGCNLDFFRSPSQWDADENVLFPSMQHEPSFKPGTGLFCEGHLTLGRNHNPEAPSKHNLLCNDEGTWFVVRRNEDFKHGTNAAKHQSVPHVTFQFVREISAPKVVIAIEVSSRMRQEDRYILVQNAFSHFLTTLLPDRSELSLIVFGGGGDVSVITSSLLLENEESRISYLEGQPLPEEPSNQENVCLDCILEEIIKLVTNENNSFTSAPEVVLVTTLSDIEVFKEEEIHQTLEQSQIRLHVLSFLDDHPDRSYQTSSVYRLCSKTENIFVSLKGDVLGNLYRAFGDVVKGAYSNVLLTQNYLTTVEDENIRFTFTLDDSLLNTLKVSLSGISFNFPPLEYDSTTLTSPTGYMIHPKKQELVPSWIFKVPTPKAGEYILETKRKIGGKSPVLVTITSSAQENTITAKVWVKFLDSKVTPPPVQIFAEVKQGPNPIRNATVVAFIHHPGMDGTSEILLVDDGLGSIDITKDDGIYSSFYSNFTSSGFYNVHIKVSGSFDDYSEILKGSPSACCGSVFSSRVQTPTGQFQREAGPVTFEVKTVSEEDLYPPTKVTDLRIYRIYDKIVVFQWTAVGDDYNSGVATAYELKLFLDRFALRNRFSDSGLEVFSETIDTTPLAIYGTTLYHTVQLPKVTQPGVHYFSIRALDEAGNAGEISNAVPVWLGQTENEITCSEDDE